MVLDSPYYRWASWVGIALIGAAMMIVAVRGNWTGAAVVACFLFASVLFVLAERRLPALFDTLFVGASIINAAGWVWDLYRPVWGYDEFAHFFTTFAATLSIGYLMLYAMRQHFRQHSAHYVLVVTSFGVTMGAWWEVLEWLFMKQLVDPVGDIVVDSAGALVAALVARQVLLMTTNLEDSIRS